MPWFKVDDSFYDHPKIYDAPDCAVALWVRAGSWSARNLTDGFVPAGIAARFCDDPDTAIKELVARGLWSRAKGGFQFHDWTEYQPTREEATAAKARKSSGGRIGNHRRWHAARGVTDPDCPYCSPSGSDNRSVQRSASDVSDVVSQGKSDGLTASDRGKIPGSNKGPARGRTDRKPHHENVTSHPHLPTEQGKHPSEYRSVSDRSTDRTPIGTPIGTPNPPVPSRPDPTDIGADVDQSSYGRNARARDDDDHSKIDTAITRILTEETGITVQPDWAARVRRQILDGRDIDKPVTYVSRALRERPRDFLPPGSPAHDGIPPELVGLAPPGERDNPANARGLAAARAAIAKTRPEPPEPPQDAP